MFGYIRQAAIWTRRQFVRPAGRHRRRPPEEPLLLATVAASASSMQQPCTPLRRTGSSPRDDVALVRPYVLAGEDLTRQQNQQPPLCSREAWAGVG